MKTEEEGGDSGEYLRLEGSIKDFFKVRVFLINIILLILLWIIAIFAYF